MDRLIAAADWTADAFSVATGLDATAQAAALCANQLDAGVVALTADPMESPAGLAGCNVVFVPVAAADGLATTVIPAGVNGNDAEVATVGRSLELVTAAGADIDAVHAVTAAIVGNLDDLRARYRALDAVDAVRVTESVALPLHDGAVRYHTAPPEEEASDDASDTATEPAPETEGGASEDSAPPAQ